MSNTLVSYDTTIVLDGAEVDVTIWAGGDSFRDSHYGADADGNRGVSMDITNVDWMEVNQDGETIMVLGDDDKIWLDNVDEIELLIEDEVQA